MHLFTQVVLLDHIGTVSSTARVLGTDVLFQVYRTYVYKIYAVLLHSLFDHQITPNVIDLGLLC